MREILFRGKRKDNGEWVEGHLIQSPYMGEVRSWISTPEDKTRLRAIATYYGDWRAVEVCTDTLCQYTGLTDKNGNKIWENDVVEVYARGYHTICIVSWAETVAHFQLWQINTIPNTPTALNLGNYDCEVLGNTFDNADLLKGE